jgi:hypothetical protein
MGLVCLPNLVDFREQHLGMCGWDGWVDMNPEYETLFFRTLEQIDIR